MRKFIPAWVRVPVIFFLIAGLAEYFIDSGDKPAFMEQPLIMLFLLFVLVLLIGIESIIGSMDNILYQSLDEEAKARYNAQRAEKPKFVVWLGTTYEKLLGSKPMEEEHDIILDHNYDGIRELDNNLPPWWKYSFYASIVFAAVYMLRYHVFDGPTQIQELEIEYAQAAIEIEEYKKTAKGLIDVNTVEVLTSAADLNSGKALYEANCVACHMADGGGGIGPNLTDEYWILGGGIKNIYRTLVEGGRAGKGMISWKQSLTPLEMAQVSSYVLAFQGTTPANPKEAEGDIWVDENAPIEDVPTKAMEEKTDGVISIEN
ncbi:cbb3-type cytochrome c oxidase N-terminal domain-containing protein [Bizionia sediminis]|uniref:Cbb3-type cytochrome c oxidase N-terminal domain-containing protein n=1 Tax=Bizionia sediminis TaxID=1737064 RepID=A0ABW5KQM7_9FLAO